MTNHLVERLFDLAKTEDNDGLTKFDEQKLRRALDGNKKLFARNADIFRKQEPRFKTCKLYNPCPICDKCLNKASHLYVRCQNCQIPICTHTYENRDKMIKRKNFKIKVSQDIINKLDHIADAIKTN